MTARTAPSSALTGFVVASRYMPVYVALVLLVVVAAIWVPETLSSVALRAIAPFAALLAKAKEVLAGYPLYYSCLPYWDFGPET